MADDPYQVLGVRKDASQKEIRDAYRKLAKDLHPDLNPGDRGAEERFKQVSSAYNLLSDPEQRARYDRGEIDATGAERPEHGFYRQHAEGAGGGRYHSTAGFEDFEDISDIFSDLFGQRAGRGGRTVRMRGRDLFYRLDVDFLDAVNGAKRRITMPNGRTIDLTVPAGTTDGTVLRLEGQGGEGIGGGPPGDAMIEIGVDPHPVFRREGNDIVMDLPVTLDEAVLGGKVQVPTVSGRVAMTVPKGSSTGDVLRLRGKGVRPARGPAGDQRVVLKVVLPETIDDELASFMRKWREKHAYDPRRELGRTA